MAQLSLDLVLLVLVGAATVHDLLSRKIPNKLVLSGLVSALLLQALSGWSALAACIGGAGVGLLVFLPLYLMRAMAAGDVKLMAMVGAFTGPALAVEICIATFCIGGVMALLIALAKGRLGDMLGNTYAIVRIMLLRMAGMPLQPEPMSTASIGSMPYGLAIALGTLILLWLRRN